MPNATTREVPSTAAILAELEAKGSEGVRKIYRKQGVGDRVFGVMMGDLRAIAKKLKKQHALGLELWDSGWFDAQVLATLIMDPRLLSEEACVRMAESCEVVAILDKLTDNVLAASPLAERLRSRWLDSPDALRARAGWYLMTAAVKQDTQGHMDLEALMTKIERELPEAPRAKKEAMNMCLVMIGVYHAALTDLAIAAGVRLGRWDDRKIPRGCTSSYPPEWIPAAIALRTRR